MSKRNGESISLNELRRNFAAIARKTGRGGRFIVEQGDAAVALVSTRVLNRLLEDEGDRRAIARRKRERLVSANDHSALLP